MVNRGTDHAVVVVVREKMECQEAPDYSILKHLGKDRCGGGPSHAV